MGNYILPTAMALGALALFFGPEGLKVLQRLLAKRKTPQPEPEPDPVQDEDLADGELTISLEDPDLDKVLALGHLISLRRMLAGNAQAQEAIDTVLVPAVMRVEVSQQ